MSVSCVSQLPSGFVVIVPFMYKGFSLMNHLGKEKEIKHINVSLRMEFIPCMNN